MREGWTYMKLGEVCNIRTGKLNANAMVEDGEYPFFTCDSNPYRIDNYAFDTEAILISGNGSLVGHVNYYKGKFNAYQRTYVLDNFSHFHIPYLLTFLKGYLRPYIKRNFKGGCIPYITLPILQSFSIPLPPKCQQEAIVSELDEINSLLALKREQLQKYDKLAQSLFYEMFGDPVENEKGWVVKNLGDFATLINGRAYKQEELLDEGKYPVLRVGNFFTNNSWYYSDLELEADKYCEKGDLLYAWSASFGPRIWNGEKVIYHYHIWKIKLSDLVDKTYLLCLLQRMTNDLKQQVHGATMVHLTKAKMEQTILPLPPLPLQQQFASRIEQIEEQKQQVQAAIEKLETLLASRMQYWFE